MVGGIFFRETAGVKRSQIEMGITNGTLTTAHLGKLCEKDPKANQKYPDSIDFLKARYNYGARHAVKRLMRDFFYKAAFDFTTFYSSKNDIKQYKLLTYVTQASNGTDFSGVNWSSISACD